MATSLKILTVQQPVTQQQAAVDNAHLVRLGEMNTALGLKADKGVVTLQADDGLLIQLRARVDANGIYQFYGVPITSGQNVTGDSTIITGDSTTVTGDMT